MKVILKQDVENVGKRGDIVNVSSGFGRNYLLPRKLATEVTASNVKLVEIEQQVLKKKLEKERLSYQDLIQRLNQVSLRFAVHQRRRPDHLDRRAVRQLDALGQRVGHHTADVAATLAAVGVDARVAGHEDAYDTR